MKKTIKFLILIAVFTVGNQAMAQGVGLGLKVGANFANQSITDASTESITGFHGGAYVVLAFSEKWAIQPELFFSSQGSEIPEFDEIINLDYFTIPVLLRYKPANFLSFEAGPQISTLLSAVDKSGDSIKEEVKNSDFGLALGTTVYLPLGLNAGFRYVWGFTNINDLSNDIEVKNKMFQIYAGWTFLGEK